MNHQKSTFWRNRPITSLVIGMLFLITAVPAYAKYKPKNRKPASGYSGAGGSRSPDNGSIPLTLLAPKTFIGKTASLRPMLAWYTPNSQNVEFRLFEFESATRVKQIGEFKEIPTVVGINKLKLPSDYPELTVGKTYLWQISSDSAGGQIINRAEFTVINPTQSLTKKKFTTIPESVNYYAENELWYEALEEALKVKSNGKLSQSGSTLVQELAESEMLTGSEAEINIIKRRIDNLEKISLSSQ
ncbi:DUF928 domain-containing protein [Calothrix sp. CCY 0018]|uniref:DUF928 domain-containing protein n=1 Tax=Calothrix sp. CCY 0018 TaxID=3103864 RepID=UPI0039C723B8